MNHMLPERFSVRPSTIEDIPAIVQAKQKQHPQIKMILTEYLGQHQRLIKEMAVLACKRME